MQVAAWKAESEARQQWAEFAGEVREEVRAYPRKKKGSRRHAK